MSKKDLFRIIIKVFALYSLIIGITYVVPQNLNAIATERMFGQSGYAVYVMILSVAFVIFLSWLLIRKADTIISWFKLDAGFDTEDATLSQFDLKTIFTFASVIIGGFLIVDFAPIFILQCYNAFKDTQHSGMLYDEFKTEWAINGVRIFIGYILIKLSHKMHLIVKEKTENNISDSESSRDK